MISTGAKKYKILKGWEYRRIYQVGLKHWGKLLVIYTSSNTLGHGRYGLSVARRVGKAHVRNRIKRLLRESLRPVVTRMPLGFDLVIVVRSGAPQVSKLEIDNAIARVIDKIK